MQILEWPLEKFKRRWGLKNFKSRGASGDAVEYAIQECRPDLQRLASKYFPEDLWNSDELGLFCKMVPEKKFSIASLPGRKKQMDRIAFHACLDSTGSENFYLIFIGKSKSPLLIRKSAAWLGLDYSNNQKSWMTSDLFFDWLKPFDLHICRTPGRKVLLFFDNCSAHGKLKTMPDMQNTTVQFLPPNATSRIQPLDAGIIVALKVKYRRRFMHCALAQTDKEEYEI